MNQRTWQLRITLGTVLAICCSLCAAEEPNADRYATRVRALVDTHEQLLKDHQRIVNRKRDLQAEYVEAQADVERLQLEVLINRLSAQNLTTRFDAAQKEAERLWEVLDASNQRPGLEFQHAMTITNGLEVMAQELEFEARRIDFAGNAVIKHMLACMQQGVELGKEAVELQRRYEKVQTDFWGVADIDGRCSREELQGALRELDLIGDDNPAALIVRGVAYRRLQRFVDAQADFDRVIQIGGPWQLVALAARGENLVAQGKSREGFAELNRAVKQSKADSRALYFHALGFAADGKYKTAEKGFRRLLATGKHDAAAHRNLAFLLSASEKSLNRPAEALKHAEVAAELADESDWLSLMARAAAMAANEDYAEAADLAERAAELTFGDKQELCRDFAEKYEGREKPVWNWK